MKSITFNSFHQKRKSFLSKFKNHDHAVCVGDGGVLVSAPHGVSQVRLGMPKKSEIGSLATAIYLHENNGCHLIAKTMNNNDDANFDFQSSYKTDVFQLISDYNIKYFVDIHGLSSQRDVDINLGTHLGRNIEGNEGFLYLLQDALISNGFKTSIDQPFMAGSQTLSSSVKEKCNIWSLQIEINCGITNKSENFNRCLLMLEILSDWLRKLR